MTPSNGVTKVRTASRSTGGVAIRLMSRTPVSASCRVRGIGVAVSVSTWTSARSSFRRSLWLTPKCCSSSTISRPRSLNSMLLASSAWVPTTMSTLPSFDRLLGGLGLLGGDQARQAADAAPAGPGSARRRCGDAGAPASVVGAMTATCLPDSAATKRRAQGHLGLAEADVAAAPAGPSACRTTCRRSRRRSPEAGRRSRRRGSARRTPRRRLRAGSSSRRAADGALGGDLDQPVGHVGDALLQPGLARLPGDAAQAGRGRRPPRAEP